MFVDNNENTPKKCPKNKAVVYCRRDEVTHVLDGVKVSVNIYQQYKNLLDAVCDFCIKEHNGKIRM